VTAVLSRSQDGRTDEVGTSSTGTPVPSRWDWRNWPVVIKLAAVLLVPTIVALVAGILRIVDQAGAAPGYARISQIVHLQQQLSDLVGQLGGNVIWLPHTSPPAGWVITGTWTRSFAPSTPACGGSREPPARWPGWTSPALRSPG